MMEGSNSLKNRSESASQSPSLCACAWLPSRFSICRIVREASSRAGCRKRSREYEIVVLILVRQEVRRRKDAAPIVADPAGDEVR
jgi:hypothetical protein